MAHVPTMARPFIRSPCLAGSGVRAMTTSRGATWTPFTVIGFVESRPMVWRTFRMLMKSAPRAYLKVAFLTSGMPRGMRTTSSCSTLTHSTGPIPSGKTKASAPENGSVV